MITQALPTGYKAELLQGVHDSADTYKIALYSSSATLNETTTSYSTANEVTGTGYTAGGATLSGFNVVVDGTTAILDFSSNPSWANATITARGALIYNSSKSNKAVYVLDFGSDISSTNGTFALTFPAPNATDGLIRLD